MAARSISSSVKHRNGNRMELSLQGLAATAAAAAPQRDDRCVSKQPRSAIKQPAMLPPATATRALRLGSRTDLRDMLRVAVGARTNSRSERRREADNRRFDGLRISRFCGRRSRAHHGPGNRPRCSTQFRRVGRGIGQADKLSPNIHDVHDCMPDFGNGRAVGVRNVGDCRQISGLRSQNGIGDSGDGRGLKAALTTVGQGDCRPAIQ